MLGLDWRCSYYPARRNGDTEGDNVSIPTSCIVHPELVESKVCANDNGVYTLIIRYRSSMLSSPSYPSPLWSSLLSSFSLRRVAMQLVCIPGAKAVQTEDVCCFRRQEIQSSLYLHDLKFKALLDMIIDIAIWLRPRSIRYCFLHHPLY